MELIITLGQPIHIAMGKILLLLVLFFFTCFQTTAQNPPTGKKKVSFGIKNGLNISHFHLEGKIPGLIESDFRTGYVAGAFVSFPVGKSPFTVQPEFLYSSMGGDLSNEFNEAQKIRVNYFSLPVLVKFNISEKLAAFAGPQVDAVFYAREKNIYGLFNITNDVESIDALATWGLEWWPWKHVVLNARHMYGFKKVYPIQPNVSTNNRGFQLTLGLRFHKAKPWVEPEPERITPVTDKDSDEDGIPDSKDKCPTIPGVAQYEGCPVPDTDKDGVFDDKDKCPEMPGYPELDGCPYPDSDKDGVTDNKDRCPDVPGSTKNEGCPILDRDHDGIQDADDKCPDTPGPASNGGCPEVTKEVIQKAAEIARNIYFEFNSSRLKTISYGPLNEMVKMLGDNPTFNLSIEGHTDNIGSETYNQTLSENRVKSVRDYLVGKGIAASRLTTKGFGESSPVADNKTEEGRAQNRRVELKISQ